MTDPDLAKATVSITSYRVASPGAEAVGLRTNQFKTDNPAHDAFPRAAEDFLVATRITRWDRDFAISVGDYFDDPMVEAYGKLDHDVYLEGDAVQLPPSSASQMDLDEAVRHRRTLRYFTGDPGDLPDIAAMVRNACAVTGVAEVTKSDGESVEYRYRATPSGGGLYPVELWFASINVRGLPRGIYRYSPLRDEFVRNGTEAEVEAVLRSVSTPEDDLNAQSAAGIFLLVGTPSRSTRKYGPRGVRFMFHEAGAISEHLHLTATALGTGSADYSSFFDDDANEALGLDGTGRMLLHMVLTGVPSE